MLDATARPSHAALSEPIGRDRELAELRGALEAARDGRGGLYLVSGEPGIGKTRLAEQLAAEAAAGGAHVSWGRCWESGSVPAYWPWVQVLRDVIQGREPAGLVAVAGGAIGQLLPELVPALPAATRLAPPTRAPVVLFDAVRAVLTAVAAERPLLVILEDLHAADESSLLLLQYLARELQQSAVLMIGSYRDWEAHSDPTKRRLLGGLARASHHVPLRGLAAPGVARFLQVAQVANAHDPGLVTEVHRATGGNPFFLLEAARTLLRRDGQPAGIPLRVRETVRRRLDGLSDDCRALLPVAAVVGQEFDRVILADVLDHTAERVATALRDAVAAGVLLARGGHRYAFAHGIIREALYEAFPSAERAQLHARIGSVLESHGPTDPDSRLAELAHHFGEAARGGADPRKAVTWSRRAAEQALSRLAFEDAVAQFQSALVALELDGGASLGVRTELLLSLGDAQRRTGEADAARDTFARAAALARRLGAADLLARAALGFGGVGRERISPDRDWIRLLEEALVALGGDDSPLRARVQACLAMALYWTEGPARRESLCRDAVAMARRLGDAATLAFTLDCHLKATWGPGGVGERLATAAEMLALAQSSGDRQLELEARRWRVVSLLERGETAAADRDIAAVGRLAEELRDPLFRWQALVWRSMRAGLDGAFARAEALAAEALAAGERVQSHNAMPVYLGQLFQLRWFQGRLGDLVAPLRALVDDGAEGPAYRSGLALAAVQGGDLELARREIDFLAAGDFAILPHDASRLSSLVTIADVVATVAAVEYAAVLYDQLLPYEGLAVVLGPGLGCFGPVARYLGLLAVATGRLAEAERHLRDALALAERMAARPWIACAQGDLAALLVRRGAAGAANGLRVAAMDTAATLGMPALVERLRGLSRAPVAAVVAGDLPCRLVREGDFWTVTFAGVTSRVPDSRGMHYLRLLLTRPGRQLHTLAMVADVQGPPETAPRRMNGSMLATLGMHRADAGDAGQVLDARARAAYRARRAELEAERDEAEAANDSGRRDSAAAELEFLDRELAAALGLGGRVRRASSPAEKARLSVTRAVRAAIARLGVDNPVLGRHLDETIRTGTACSYGPDPRVTSVWHT